MKAIACGSGFGPTPRKESRAGGLCNGSLSVTTHINSSGHVRSLLFPPLPPAVSLLFVVFILDRKEVLIFPNRFACAYSPFVNAARAPQPRAMPTNADMLSLRSGWGG